MDGIIDTFANRLNTAMRIRGIKATELSEKTGISKSSLSEYINGKYEAKQDGVYLLAKALDVNEAWLMGLDVPMERKWEKDIEEKPVETANKLADLFLGIEIKETDAETKLMLDDYLSLDDTKKAQVREYVHFLATKN